MARYIRPHPRTHYCGIYAIEHISGARYIGGSKDITGRYTHHRFTLRRGINKTRALQELWTQDGEETFEFKTLELCEPEMLREREEYWISITENLLNTVPGAVPGMFSEPSENKKAAAVKRWADPDYRAKREDWLNTRTALGRFVRKDE